MKILTLFCLTFVSVLVLSGCNPKQQTTDANTDPDQMQNGEMKDGEHSTYYPDGKLKYKVEYKDGKANGRVRQYYTDGKLYMEAVFKDGRRNGKCTYFFKNGSAYSVSNYVNGNKEGIESKYWENGKLLSVNTYKKDKVQPGLKEYKQDGTLIDNEVKLLIKEVDHTSLEGKYYLYVSLSNPKIVANFFSRTASEEIRQKLKMTGNSGIVEFNLAPRQFLFKHLIIDAEYKTPRGNTMRLQREYNLAVN